MAVSLLGGPRISAGAVSMDCGALGRRAQLVLARLALEHGEPVSREALADVVWGPAPPRTWRTSIRNAISELRRALADAGLEVTVSLTTHGEGYSLELPEGSTVDVTVLREAVEETTRLLAERDWAGALALADARLTDASRTLLPGGAEEWVEGLRAEIAQLRVGLLLAAGEAALGAGDDGRGERLARLAIAGAPLREDAHRLLIRSLRASARRAEALAAYDGCRRLLADELGAMPSPATQELFMEILTEERAELPRLSSRGERAPVPGALLRLAESTPFVGRARLMGALVSRARVAAEAGAFAVSLRGEPGIGKTRLAAELALACHRDGLAVLYGRAEDRLRLPYAAFVDALERALPDIGRSELRAGLGDQLAVLGALLPALRSGGAHEGDPPAIGSPTTNPPAIGSPTTDPERLRAAIVTALRTVIGRDGGLLVLDDMQWASRAELEVVRALLSDPEEARMLVLMLHRRPDDPAGLPELGENPRVARCELEPLGLEDVRALAQLGAVGGSEADDPHLDERARHVWRASGGNALLASELFSVAGGEPVQRLPARVGELVAERLAQLPPGTEEVLRIAALAGDEFDAGLVSEVSAAGGARAGELLDEARAARLLVESGEAGGHLSFRHGLVRDALLDALDPEERSRLHRRLALRLESDPSTDPAALVRLAHHFAAAGPVGDWRRTLSYALPVVRAAQAAGVYEDVMALGSRTLDALERAGDPDPGAALELSILVGGAQRALGDPRGHETLARAFAAAKEQGEPAAMADAALALAPLAAVSEALYLDDRQLALYEEALEALGESEPARRARLLARLASANAWRLGERAARPFARRAEALARERNDEPTLAAVLAAVRLASTGAGDTDRLRGLDAELAGLALRLGDPGLRASAALWTYASSVQRGAGDRLEGLLAEASGQARTLRVASLHHAVAFEQAALALLRGRLVEAEMLIARAAEIGRRRGLDPSLVESIRLTQLMHLRGEQRCLGTLRPEAAPLFESAGVTVWLGAMAVIDVAAGRLDGAGERIDAVLSDYERSGPAVMSSGAVVAYMAQTAVRLGDRDRAARIHRLVEPLAGQGAYFAGFAGPIDYHLALLERFLDEPGNARPRFAAAAAFCERLGAPRWRARCELGLADDERPMRGRPAGDDGHAVSR